MPQAGWGLLIRDTGDSVFRYSHSYGGGFRRDSEAGAPARGYFCGEDGARLDSPGPRGQARAMNVQSPTPFPGRPTEKVAFDRKELAVILGIYGRMVAAGEWRDYGMSFLKDVAIFSIFRRAAEHPIYRIEKRPELRNRQGMYSVIGMDGQILKRGHDLKTVLRVLERKMIRAVD